MSKRPPDNDLRSPRPRQRARARTPPTPPTLDSWLTSDPSTSTSNPTSTSTSTSGARARPLLATSPALHAQNSTFLAFTYAFEAPPHVRSAAALKSAAARVVRSLDVVRVVGAELIEEGEGAFANGQGRKGRLGRERAREPDHRMWAVRSLGLLEGRDGTGGEGDYHLLEAYDDDGERYGGERVLRVLQDERAVDVLTICCRWFGGDMLGPARFQHIGLTAKDSTVELLAMVQRRDLRNELEVLDEEIAAMRETIGGAGGGEGGENGARGKNGTIGSEPGTGEPPAGAKENPGESQRESQRKEGRDNGKDTRPTTDAVARPPSSSAPPPGKYNDIDDIARLQRLVGARTKTREMLEKRVGWAAMDAARGV